MSLVSGKNCLLYVYDGAWKLCACARSVSLNVDTEVIETSVSGTNNYATFLPTKNSFAGTLEGVVALAESNMLGLPDLRSFQLAHVKLLMRFQRTSESGSIYTDECNFFISNTTDTGTFDGIATWTMELRGTGIITQVFTPTTQPTTNKVKRYQDYTPIQDATGFTEALLISKDILGVWKDGIGNCLIITTGTPLGKEVKYTSASGTFLWAIPFEADEDPPFILYQDL